MSPFETFGGEERAQIDAMVHDAYIREDGSVRTNAEATQEFDRMIADAVQAHREWAGALMDDWRYAGMKRFIHERWKVLEGRFGFAHRGRTRERTLRRGTLRRDEQTGREVWVQDTLLDFTTAALERAIAQCVSRIDEERANIAMYRALLDLLETTQETTVRAALDKADVSLEEYLASRSAA